MPASNRARELPDLFVEPEKGALDPPRPVFLAIDGFDQTLELGNGQGCGIRHRALGAEYLGLIQIKSVVTQQRKSQVVAGLATQELA